MILTMWTSWGPWRRWRRKVRHLTLSACVICLLYLSELDVSASSFSLSEEAIRATEHQLWQRLPQHSLRVREPVVGLTWPVSLQPGEETTGGAGSWGERSPEEGLPPGTLPLSEHHWDSGLPTQTQNKHRDQLVPQLQASAVISGIPSLIPCFLLNISSSLGGLSMNSVVVL